MLALTEQQKKQLTNAVPKDPSKERRIIIAREINKLNNQLMQLGSWDESKTAPIVEKIKTLEAERLSTYNNEEAHKKDIERIHSKGKSIWPGSYCDWLGWGWNSAWKWDINKNGSITVNGEVDNATIKL